ncbi:MAG: HAD-IIB family hydrolase, partial [Candidatus Pacebacteria bacterium]|nr:HAD-IIB family hydrolase [Candidatus Paceibacterota bacterium]
MSLAKKIVAFDLDGTLTESKQPLSREMADLLSQLALQVKIGVISGGSFDQFKKQFLPAFSQPAIFSQFSLLPTSGDQQYEYAPATNEWRLTSSQIFPTEIKVKVLEALKGLDGPDKYDLPSEIFGEQIEDRGTQITFSAMGQLAPVNKKILWDPDQSKRKKIVEDLETKLPEVTIAIGGATSIDFLPKGFNKAEGLKKMLAEFKFRPEDIIFVGDKVFPGGNDYSPREAGVETLSVNGPAETAALIKKWLGEDARHYQLTRHPANPILQPSANAAWEKEGVFNPGVVKVDYEVIMLYRAVGERESYTSHIGLAKSKDGISFERLSKEPVFGPKQEFDKWATEDPRITQIEEDFYVTYVA